jgi:tetratricopeptide (TPR) repeat protein
LPTSSSERGYRAALPLALAGALCLIPAAAPAAPITFSKDVAPIVYAKCAMCHHPEGAAPFSLLTYASARAHASQIAAVTRSGFMPPWKADAPPGGFVGQPHLTAAELDLLQQWVDAGAPEGDPHDLPAAPGYTSGWQLGRPDLVVTPPRYSLQAEGTDVFRIFVIPLPVDGVKFVRGLEFRPGNARVVHHANIRIDRTRTSRGFDDADPAPGYSGLIAQTATYPDGHFLGWTPGQVAPLLPKGLAWRLQPGTDLVVELHMQPSGREESVQPSVGLYFTADPPDRIPSMLRLGRQNIDIPPGTSDYTVTDSFVLPVDVVVEAVQPHAHYRARDVTGTATLPDGTIRQLIHIGDWDFRWQHVYRYAQPFALPAGTRLAMHYVYDNSADNPKNPDHPPRRVYWGQRSADEMGDLWIQVLTRNDHDLQVLDTAFAPKIMAEDVVGYERWIQSDPKSAALHDDVGLLYLRLNRADDAVRHFAISAGLQPDSASAHFNLGTALTLAGKMDAAVAEYRRALAIKPDYSQAHNNLGGILLRTGQIDEAISHFNDAMRLDPANAEAHYNAGMALQQKGRTPDAAEQFRLAVKLKSDWPPALADLAWLLAVTDNPALQDPAQAVRLAERAVALTGQRDPAALDVLAAAYAAAGEFDRAVDAEEAALKLSPANARQITERRNMYRARQPYRIR